MTVSQECKGVDGIPFVGIKSQLIREPLRGHVGLRRLPQGGVAVLQRLADQGPGRERGEPLLALRGFECIHIDEIL